MRVLVVRDAVGALDDRARALEQAGEHDAVRLVDLPRRELLARPAELGAGRDDRDSSADARSAAPRCPPTRAPRSERRRGACLRASTRSPAATSPPRGRTFAPAGTASSMRTTSPVDRDAARSAPPRRRRPARRLRWRSPSPRLARAARRRARLRRRAPTIGSSPGVSVARSAKPSIAELGKRGRSIVASASSARTRPIG